MKYTIKDGKRNEEFEVGSEGEVLSALRLLRKKELEEFKRTSIRWLKLWSSISAIDISEMLNCV